MHAGAVEVFEGYVDCNASSVVVSPKSQSALLRTDGSVEVVTTSTLGGC